jgi:hypothetical protein
MKRNITIACSFAAAIAVLGLASAALERRAFGAEARVEVPMFEVAPFWPRPLPNPGVQGGTVGLGVDSQDHIWVVHRPGSLEPAEKYGADKLSDCCFPAPPVLEFDQSGNLVNHWGGPGDGYDWPPSEHGVTADSKGNVWLAGGGNQILKFTRAGKFLLQIGKPKMSKGSNDTANLNSPTEVAFDAAANEAYVSDGYRNRRVIVFDADTGAYKRHWGGYGKPPNDEDPYNSQSATVGKDYDPSKPSQQFGRAVHSVNISRDNLVYVADRTNDRVQVFRKDGTFVKEGFIERDTRGDGSAFDVAFSNDPAQKYAYVADGSNNKVHILLRSTMEELATFGDGGRQPGQFYAVHNIATDSKGNIYTVETRRGQRVQKFVYKGIGQVAKKDQGVLWPKSANGR